MAEEQSMPLLRKKMQKSITQLQKVNVELYQLKPKINQIYFSILLTQEKKKILLAKQKQVKEKLKEVKAGVKYGALLPTSDAILESELLKVEQQLKDTESTKQNLMQTLEKIYWNTCFKCFYLYLS